MKKYLYILINSFTLLVGFNLFGATVTFINDTSFGIPLVRVRFQNAKTKKMYWTDWKDISDHTAISSTDPNDLLYAFQIKKDRIYQISDFHSETGIPKNYETLPHDSLITIRDKKIEISAEPAPNKYWIAEKVRQS